MRTWGPLGLHPTFDLICLSCQTMWPRLQLYLLNRQHSSVTSMGTRHKHRVTISPVTFSTSVWKPWAALRNLNHPFLPVCNGGSYFIFNNNVVKTESHLQQIDKAGYINLPDTDCMEDHPFNTIHLLSWKPDNGWLSEPLLLHKITGQHLHTTLPKLMHQITFISTSNNMDNVLYLHSDFHKILPFNYVRVQEDNGVM